MLSGIIARLVALWLLACACVFVTAGNKKNKKLQIIAAVLFILPIIALVVIALLAANTDLFSR